MRDYNLIVENHNHFLVVFYKWNALKSMFSHISCTIIFYANFLLHHILCHVWLRWKGKELIRGKMGGKEKYFSFFGRRENGVGDFSPSSKSLSNIFPPIQVIISYIMSITIITTNYQKILYHFSSQPSKTNTYSSSIIPLSHPFNFNQKHNKESTNHSFLLLFYPLIFQ